ncbi:osteocalcin 2 [Drosophila hydei]|uniref:Osteocalcin 2 n=1 Tax=Drosophila hydei TaxID=7224 RepID=A0A6J1M3R8_DROHY|nr:osteocalcin 2 [Drosophila hydei]
MVNELNKPQDNAALSELLAASNRQLEEMQEEHRQLQAELTRLSAQRQQLRMATREQESVSVVTTESQSSLATAESAATEEKDNATNEDKEETANYLQEKLAEIANLKAQFKRVQHMTDSTKRIEEHISSTESKSSSSSTVQQSRQTMTAESVQSSSSSSSTSRSALSSEAESSTSRAAPDNAELLNAMINMVTDFTSDLRGQEESLRAERLRIKTLKEEIIQRKQGK